MTRGPPAVRLLPLAALAAACASAGSAPRPDPAPAATASRPAAPAPEPAASPRGQRLFEEAVAAQAEQRKLPVPPDGQVMELKWRTAASEGVPEAWFNLGVLLEEQGRPAEARAAYQSALSLRPSFREAAVNLSFLEAAGAEPGQAAQAYVEILRRFPDDGPLRARLAALYLEAGQLDEAWRLALQRDPAVRGAYPVMMRVALERGDLDLAELVAVRARKLDAGDPEVSHLLGRVQERRGDEGSALAQYRRAVAQGGYLPSRYRLLELTLSARSWEAAAEQARAILQRSPDDARVRLALGVALRNQGKVDEALAEYERAEALSAGRLPEVFLARGAALARGKGQCEPALAQLDRYESARGPAAAIESPAPALRKECQQLLASARQAEEAARQMQAEAQRKAAAAQPAAAAPAAPQTGAPAAAPMPPAEASAPATPR